MKMKRRSYVREMGFYMCRILFLLVAEVGGNLAPFLGFPFDDGNGGMVGGEPSLGTGYEFVGFGCRVIAHEFGLAMLVAHPEDGVVRVGVDGLIAYALLVHEGQGVYDGKEFADVVGATDGAEVEDLRPCGQVDALIFHRSWVSGAGGVHSPRVCSHLRRQGQHGVVAIVRW